MQVAEIGFMVMQTMMQALTLGHIISLNWMTIPLFIRFSMLMIS